MAVGEEAKIDFGLTAPIVITDENKRQTRSFSVVISCSEVHFAKLPDSLISPVATKTGENLIPKQIKEVVYRGRGIWVERHQWPQ